jgi:mannose-6-phosphate isomerase-like protein (cupin superfamily)
MNQLTRPELDAFLAELRKLHSRDAQHVTEPHLVVHSGDAHWLTGEQTGNPSHIGLLRHIPMKTVEFFLQFIPADTASDLQRHVHESIHFVLEGTGWSEVGDQLVHWGKGDFVFTPPWIWHRHYAGEDDVQMLIIENSRLLNGLDADQRESLGNVSFAEAFAKKGSGSTSNPELEQREDAP